MLRAYSDSEIKTAIFDLETVKMILATPDRWTKHVLYWETTRSYCLSGAINKAVLNNPYRTGFNSTPLQSQRIGIIESELRSTIGNRYSLSIVPFSLSIFNDDPTTKYVDVISIIDLTIHRLQQCFI